MKWIIISVVGMLIFCALLYGQIAYGPSSIIYKETFTVTFGTSKTADTTAVSGAVASDRYLVTPTLQPNGKLWAIARAGTLIINSTVVESSLTCNVVRFR